MEKTITERIEAITPPYLEQLITMLEVYEAYQEKEMEPQATATLTTPYLETSPEASTDNNIMTWGQSFMWMRYGISFEAIGMVDDALCAVLVVRNRIESNPKTNDVRTEVMIVCIESHLHGIYDSLKGNRQKIIEAFNRCYSDDAIRSAWMTTAPDGQYGASPSHHLPQRGQDGFVLQTRIAMLKRKKGAKNNIYKGTFSHAAPVRPFAPKRSKFY